MALSVSTVIEPRRNLYWNKYKYCIQFKQQKASCLRDINNLDASIETHKYWERQRQINSSYSRHTDSFTTAFTTTVVNNLHLTADCIKQFSSDVKVVCSSWDTVHVYTNSETAIEAVELLSHVAVYSKKKADISIPTNTILLKDPKYKFRTYFKNRKLGKEGIKQLKSWLLSQGKEVELAPSLKYWVKTGGGRWARDSDWTEDYWFVNHNIKSYESMIGMIAPGLVRKTMILQRR